MGFAQFLDLKDMVNLKKTCKDIPFNLKQGIDINSLNLWDYQDITHNFLESRHQKLLKHINLFSIEETLNDKDTELNHCKVDFTKFYVDWKKNGQRILPVKANPKKLVLDYGSCYKGYPMHVPKNA